MTEANGKRNGGVAVREVLVIVALVGTVAMNYGVMTTQLKAFKDDLATFRLQLSALVGQEAEIKLLRQDLKNLSERVERIDANTQPFVGGYGK